MLLQFVRERDGRELRRVQNLIRIRVANAADETRICESPLERTVFGRECGPKRCEIARENINSSGIDGSQSFLARNDVQRCSTLCSGFGKNKRTVGKIESRQTLPA